MSPFLVTLKSTLPVFIMQRLRFLLAVSATSLAIVLLVGIVYAGSLSPSADPAATSYTLSDIYMRLTTNATATAGTHDFAPSASPASTFYTLTQVYDAIPTIDATKVFTGSTYLGVTGTLTGACVTSTFDASANKVANAYDGAGDGTNRWCMTDSGDASASEILSGQVAWVDGVALTGTMSAGADLSDMFNGSLTAGGFPGGSQANGGVDDYNNAAAPESDRYEATWTACTAGNSYCDTGDTGADAQDNNTGLIWSLPCNGSACASFSDSSPLTYTWDSSGGNNGGRTAAQICSDHAGWSLPHQKQLMQAYIDGSYGNLEASGVYRVYWSATTVSFYTPFAWFVNFSYGFTSYSGKTTGYFVRCVRSAP